MVVRGYLPLPVGKTVTQWVMDFAVEPHERQWHALTMLVIREATAAEYEAQPEALAARAQGQDWTTAPYHYLVATD